MNATRFQNLPDIGHGRETGETRYPFGRGMHLQIETPDKLPMLEKIKKERHTHSHGEDKPQRPSIMAWSVQGTGKPAEEIAAAG